MVLSPLPGNQPSKDLSIGHLKVQLAVWIGMLSIHFSFVCSFLFIYFQGVALFSLFIYYAVDVSGKFALCMPLLVL